MRLPARGLLLALIASSVACDRLSPRLVIVPTAGGVTLDMQTLRRTAEHFGWPRTLGKGIGG
jgi:hypothetical protein